MATDLDGTLLRSDGSLSERTRAALAAAKEADMRMALVTGRPPLLREYFDQREGSTRRTASGHRDAVRIWQLG
ncbi:HAD family hydrolase [Streptomyces bobili]|uniref:HAD family hydrolase n=1 Tax=Streptomyces bobili TaxID=67280 RepID=UPI00382241CD